MRLEQTGVNLYIVELLCTVVVVTLSALLFYLVRSILFLFPAETAHDWGLKGMSLLYRWGLIGLLRPRVPDLPVRVMGLEFPNPVGLSAGLDKNADYVDALGSLGFGFIEVGTITPRAQPGNPKPRLFRLSPEQAIINRMGFNNKGVEHLVAQLRGRRYQGIVGVNIGKNLSTKVEDAHLDYLHCLNAVYEVADYVVVNLSSPNTPGLRSLQFGEQLEQLLELLKSAQEALRSKHAKNVPLLLKVAPDLSSVEINSIAKSVIKHGFDGLIVSNTTLGRAGVAGSPYKDEAGGLSGAPLTATSTQVLHQFFDAVQGRLPLIGVGGIMQGQDAAAKGEAGASLVQLYSGFIYSGPPLIRDCVKALKDLRRG